MNKNLTVNSELFRLTFNTAFIGHTNTMFCNRWQIEPENLHKDFNKFDEGFSIFLEFADFCTETTNE